MSEKINRSARTGKFVSKKYAKKHKATTVTESVKPSQKEIEEWKAKAQKLDALEASIAKFYCNTDGDYDEENPERKGDLGDIGEVAARAFGWL